MGRTLHQLLVSSTPLEKSIPSSSKVCASNRQVSGIFPSGHDLDVELIPRSPQELFEITCLVGELLPGLPGDGVFAVDALLASPGTLVRDSVAVAGRPRNMANLRL
jgi:hypothetical protein